MVKDYLKTFGTIAASWIIPVLVIGVLLAIFTEGKILKYISHFPVALAIVGLFLICVSYNTYLILTRPLRDWYNQELKGMQDKLNRAIYEKEGADKNAEVWKASTLERSSGFPTLMAAIQEYEKAKDDSLAIYLVKKDHPALKAAEAVREQTRRRREAESQAKTTQAIIDYYEAIAPFLIDLKGDLIDAKYEDGILREFNDDERQDPVTNYLTKEEYRKLSSIERNQLALDRFWSRPKSKRLLGRLYERYVGFLYEKQNYQVDYQGIFKGYEDLGRDLICLNQYEDVVIQCKNWSQFKTIYEKHIFQFFGTVFQYKDSHLNRKVRAIFYTTTQVSDLARRFADELDIELKENFKFDQSYPCIKCNINLTTKERIYHLPFDQQYDNTKIFNPGEFYCQTVKEAEEAGFRRALRWQGNKEQAGHAKTGSVKGNLF